MGFYSFNQNIQMGWVKTYQIRWVMGGFMDMDKICHPYSHATCMQLKHWVTDGSYK